MFGNNEVMKGDDTFYVSYNADALGAQDVETALVKKRKDKIHDAPWDEYDFFILNGDFRKEYKELIPQGYDVCKKFFEDNIDKRSSWSN